ncbi:MAG TPA: hypothetical protein VF558_01250 [Rubrobacteraceae bacterium]
MDKISVFDRRATSIHEVGHALRLAHPSGSRKSKQRRDVDERFEQAEEEQISPDPTP